MALSVLCAEENRQPIRNAMKQAHPDVELHGEERTGRLWTLWFNSNDIEDGMVAMQHGAVSVTRASLI